jgi:hypothetical protein
MPFTADDVIFNWRFATNPDTAAITSGAYLDMKLEKIDSHTVRVVFDKPTPFWPGTYSLVSLIPKHVFSEHRHLLFSVRLLAQAGQHGVPGCGGLHGHDDGDLVVGAAPTRAANKFATQVRIIDLDAPVEFAPVFAHAHGLQDLVFHQPGTPVAHPELAHQLQGRDVVLGLAEQLQREKPAHQRQLAGLEHGPRQQAALVGAAAALPVGQAAAFEPSAGGPLQLGQTKPAGHRAAASACWHCASVPYRSKNCGIDKPD